jgi:hypothetical protein
VKRAGRRARRTETREERRSSSNELGITFSSKNSQLRVHIHGMIRYR